MKTLEELAKEIYDEAIAEGDIITEADALEAAKMEMKRKKMNNYTQSDKPRAKAKRTVKIDEEKVHLLNMFKVLLEGYNETEQVEVVNKQNEIAFRMGGNDYSLKLIKHRPTKGDK